jgi:hypothetical protein
LLHHETLACVVVWLIFVVGTMKPGKGFEIETAAGRFPLDAASQGRR